MRETFFQNQCIAGLKKQFGNEYPDVLFDPTLKVMHDEIVKPTNWRINSDGLTMIFGEYVITSHADPVDPITIPWNGLRPYLQSGFVVPQ